MDSKKLGNVGKIILGVFMIILGVLSFSFLIVLGTRNLESLGIILLCNILLSSFFISKGIGIGFMGDELEESIVVDGNTSFSTVVTSRYLVRKMIVCFIDSVATFISAIVSICISPSVLNIIGCVLLIVAAVILLLVALASKGDIKKMKKD